MGSSGLDRDLERKRIRSVGGGGAVGIAVLVLLLCEDAAGLRGNYDGITDYTSFVDTDAWGRQYSQTCRGKSKDDFREPRYTHLPVNLRPAWESKTPISILSKETVRKTGPGSNTTLHIYNNPGKRGAYSVAYGFQRDKECIHGQDTHCIVSRSFGTVRALVLNAERFKKGENLNFIKDHFLNEEPEEHVTILNGGSPYERKFYEAVFLGGYIPKALQSRGKSSHVIDGKSYPMEIYMYFVDETVPSMSLATILVVLVEESEKDNPHIKPVINAVKEELYDKERRYLHTSEALLRREHQFHHEDPGLKFEVFNEHQMDSEQTIRQERFKSAANMDEDLASQMEVFEKMQALESQLLVLDEDYKNAKISRDRASEVFHSFATIRAKKAQYFPYEHDELYFIANTAATLAPLKWRKGAYRNYERWVQKKEYFKEFKWDEFMVKTTPRDSDDETLGNYTLAEAIVEETAHYNDEKRLRTELKCLWKEIRTAKSRDLGVTLNKKRNLSAVAKTRLMGIIWNLTLHGQKYSNWNHQNRHNSTKMTNEEKYRRIKTYQDLLAERKVINGLVYDYFFREGNPNLDLHSRAKKEWNWTWAVPEFKDTDNPEWRKRTFVDSVINIIDKNQIWDDYDKYLNRSEKALHDLAKANNFEDVDTMRKVLHEHKFGYKTFNEWSSRNKLHDAYFERELPYQQKRKSLVELGNPEMSDKDNKEEEDTQPVKTIIKQAFQVSWLLPPNGGYYYYAGSSPVPPCYRAQNVIVFKKPIEMSRYQIEWLTTVPQSFDKRWDIPFTTPILHGNKFKVMLAPPLGSKTRNFRYEEVIVPVFNQPRNHLFLGLDGVQKNAVIEYEKRQALREKSAAISWMSPSRIQIICIVAFGLTFH